MIHLIHTFEVYRGEALCGIVPPVGGATRVVAPFDHPEMCRRCVNVRGEEIAEAREKNAYRDIPHPAPQVTPFRLPYAPPTRSIPAAELKAAQERVARAKNGAPVIDLAARRSKK